MQEVIKQYLKESSLLLDNFLADNQNITKIDTSIQWMHNSIQNGGKIISCGNGGSMSDAMHFAEELSGKFREERIALPAIAISDPSFISCVANDYGYASVFSRFIEAMGKPNDVLLAISTSGNSENIIHAVMKAKEIGIKTISLSGKDGGRLKQLTNLDINVPWFGFADHIQELHIKIIHCIILGIEKKISKT